MKNKDLWLFAGLGIAIWYLSMQQVRPSANTYSTTDAAAPPSVDYGALHQSQNQEPNPNTYAAARDRRIAGYRRMI